MCLSSSRWHTLKCKPGKNKTEYRGELEVSREKEGPGRGQGVTLPVSR
jgi:hypothetical protein